MSEKGFIKIHRKLLEWRYIDVPQAVSLWVQLILMANWTSGYWHGIEVERGTFITSYQKLSEATGLSVQQVRHWLGIFEKDGQITRKTTNKFTLISIDKYYTYQALEDAEQQAKQQTNNKQTTNKQQTNNNNIRIYKKNKKKEEVVEELPTPTLDEVIAYCETRHSTISPTRFYNYYKQRNWLVSGKVINWQAKVQEWEASEYNTKQRTNELPSYIQKQKQGTLKQGKKASKETVEKVKELQGKYEK